MYSNEDPAQPKMNKCIKKNRLSKGYRDSVCVHTRMCMCVVRAHVSEMAHVHKDTASITQNPFFFRPPPFSNTYPEDGPE